MNVFKKLFAAVLMCCAFGASAQQDESGVTGEAQAAICTGEMFNPMNIDWNNLYPITIVGMQINGSGYNENPVLMQAMPPICYCPSVMTYGYPTMGEGLTYWEPMYLVEVERRPGCMPSMGGMQVLKNYANQGSEKSTGEGLEKRQANRMNVHFITYPVLDMIDQELLAYCKNPSGVDVTYMTEVDPMWQDDTWSGIFTPEASIFTGLTAHAACAVDAAASTLGHTIDALFWCAGAWGNLYPLSGNTSHAGQDFAENNLIAAKFIARFSRLGLLFTTIGPSAICASHPNPMVVKGQYRFNQVGPINRTGRAVVFGDMAEFQYPPTSNAPTQEHTINMIWQGKQCCYRVP
ncbi:MULTISPECIES: TraU family protein [unclassified Variovorax]|uniref:TraU family protein n=1 Tax=unclassified Variovorax TaxID=663243 RepID=UPI00076DB09C|nr:MULTISPECIES: TraU family protein [unclassified Variovorax]KWT86104.1 IncF plasmid conjugative transfer pilus assembly protein TraU [Variovorax sp. WDL1]PNG50093.1 hypothetical protein CHC06_05716 [Variovorax sp. B2]PNG50965.1 hypothetical protein CHC07_05621 [Variovorax sp. B4]VTV17127.1 hypothetical protein WDL1P1_00130 [Variovorax sp. WDL1]